METLVVSPAYGRDYSSKAKAIHAWNNGDDFIIHGYKMNNRYVNRTDALRTTATHIQIRYRQMAMVTVIPNL